MFVFFFLFLSLILFYEIRQTVGIWAPAGPESYVKGAKFRVCLLLSSNTGPVQYNTATVAAHLPEIAVFTIRMIIIIIIIMVEQQYSNHNIIRDNDCVR